MFVDIALENSWTLCNVDVEPIKFTFKLDDAGATDEHITKACDDFIVAQVHAFMVFRKQLLPSLVAGVKACIIMAKTVEDVDNLAYKKCMNDNQFSVKLFGFPIILSVERS